MDHIKTNKLSFVPYKHGELELRQKNYHQNFEAKNSDSYHQSMEKSERLREFQGKLLSSTGGSDAKNKAQLINSIPESFLGCLPINQAIFPIQGEYPPLKEVSLIDNKSYERMQNIEGKRQVEESICQVAGAQEQPPMPVVESEEPQKEFVFQNQQD